MSEAVSVQIVTAGDLMIATGLVLTLALLNVRTAPHLAKDLCIAVVRLVVQLLLIGLILKFVFASVNFLLVAVLGVVMLLLAAREVTARLKHEKAIPHTFIISCVSLLLSSFVLTVFALTIIIQNPVWYHPQYAIPLLGMMLGNGLTGVSLSLTRLQEIVSTERPLVENRLMLGQTIWQATETQRRAALTNALIPTINSMAAAGIVALPGMMTGQILAGVDPELAVRYQILIFLLIAAGTGMGAFFATRLACAQLFDARGRVLDL